MFNIFNSSCRHFLTKFSLIFSSMRSTIMRIRIQITDGTNKDEEVTVIILFKTIYLEINKCKARDYTLYTISIRDKRRHITTSLLTVWHFANGYYTVDGLRANTWKKENGSTVLLTIRELLIFLQLQWLPAYRIYCRVHRVARVTWNANFKIKEHTQPVLLYRPDETNFIIIIIILP